MRLAVLVAAGVLMACGGPAQHEPPDAGAADSGAPLAPLHPGTLRASLTQFAPNLDGTMTIVVQGDGTVSGQFVPADPAMPTRSITGSATGTGVRLDLLLSDPRFDFATDWHVIGDATTAGITGNVAFDSRTDPASGFVAVYQ